MATSAIRVGVEIREGRGAFKGADGTTLGVRREGRGAFRGAVGTVLEAMWAERRRGVDILN